MIKASMSLQKAKDNQKIKNIPHIKTARTHKKNQHELT